MSWPTLIRIVGVGSPHGDDALGWEAVRILREQIKSRPDIETHLAGGGQRLLELLDGRGTLVLIDAVLSGAEPGAIHHFEWPDPRLEFSHAGSTHDLRPAEALRLAQTLEIAPERVIVFAMEIENADQGQGLSQAVQARLPELVGRVVEELFGPDNFCHLDHNDNQSQEATVRPEPR